MEVDLGIGAGKEFALRIGHVHFCQQRPRVHPDCVTRSRDGASASTMKVYGRESASLTIHICAFSSNTQNDTTRRNPQLKVSQSFGPFDFPDASLIFRQPESRASSE